LKIRLLVLPLVVSVLTLEGCLSESARRNHYEIEGSMYVTCLVLLKQRCVMKVRWTSRGESHESSGNTQACR
jgi:hypothetical protein